MKKMLALLLALLMSVATLTSCDGINFGANNTDQETEGDGSTTPISYTFTFVSNGDGTCKITGVTFEGDSPEAFTLAFPEASPEGDRVTAIDYRVASIVPRWITKEDYIAKIDGAVKSICGSEFEYRRFSTYYSLVELNDSMTKKKMEELLKTYPILETTPIYTIAHDVSEAELLYMGDVLAKAGFTYADCVAAHTATGDAQATEGLVAYPAGRTAITFPSGLTYVNPQVYLNAVGLNVLTVPDSVTELAASAGSGNRGWQEIRLPKTLKKLAERAIECPNVTEIRYEGTLAEWDAIEKTKDSVRVGSGAKVICSDGEKALA